MTTDHSTRSSRAEGIAGVLAKIRRAWKLLKTISLVSILQVLPLVVLMATLAAVASSCTPFPLTCLPRNKCFRPIPRRKRMRDGSVTVVDVRMVEVTTLGKWTYLYRERHQASGRAYGDGEAIGGPPIPGSIPKSARQDDITDWGAGRLLDSDGSQSGFRGQWENERYRWESGWWTRMAHSSRCCERWAATCQRFSPCSRA